VAPLRDERGDDARHLEHAEHGAVAQLLTISEREQQGVRPGVRARAGQEAHRRAHPRVVRVVLEGLHAIAEVANLVEGARVGLQVAVDEPGMLAVARELAEPAADLGQEPEDHPAVRRATTRKPMLSSGRRRAACRFQALSRRYAGSESPPTTSITPAHAVS
jgi:hypothetical protein